MRKKIREDYRVTVWPGSRFSRTPGDEHDCRDIMEQINRHVDGIKSLDLEFTDRVICEFCKSEWEEDENGQPLCCHKAVEEWEAADAKEK